MLLLVVLVAVATAPCALAGPASSSVVLLTSGGGDEVLDHLALAEAIEAHLSPFGVEVTLAPPGTEGPEQTARSMADEQELLALTWLDAAGTRLLVLVPSLGEEPIARDAPDAGEGWNARCELLASMVVSQLRPVLVQAAADPPPPEVDSAGGDGESGPGPAPDPAVVTVDEPEPGERPGDREPWALVLSARYAPVWFSADIGPRQGVGIGVAVQARRYMDLGLSVDLNQPIALAVPEGSAAWRRGHARLVATPSLPLGRLRLGADLGLVLEVAKVAGLDYEPAAEEASRTRISPGLTAAGRIRIEIVEWLAPFVEVGGDLYFGRHHVVYGDTPLCTRPSSQLRMAAGVSWLVSLEE